jgi:1,4-alpha-glucan branching enzyme
MIDLDEVSATVSKNAANNWQIHFGIYLPGITFNKGYSLVVRVIHEKDQFIRGIEPQEYWLNWVNPSDHDLWEITIPLTNQPGSNFGSEGKYLYRYQLFKNNQTIAFWFSDPFSKEASMGTLSSVYVGDVVPFAWTDNTFQIPEFNKMVVYELNIREFNTDFDGIIDQLPYLWDLGVNVIELMPVTNVKEDVEWGYTPLNYFAVDERFGGADGLKKLINACHHHNIAVILDAVYAHAHPEFAYNFVYDATGEYNPMMGRFCGEFFGNHPGTDYTKEFTRDYFLNVNKYFLDEFHVDGFRYDYVPGMYDGPTGVGYADLVSHTYQYSKTLPKFWDGQKSTLIQCAEQLEAPVEIVSKTYSNCTWQNALLDKSRDMLQWGYVNETFAHLLDPEFGPNPYPSEYVNPSTGDRFPVAPFQYIESHDHPRFLNVLPTLGLEDIEDQNFGDRSFFYKTQPFVIALYTAKGIPMLWQGQEFGEDWGLPDTGLVRNLFERPLHWEYFYDGYGKALIRLYRILGNLRRNSASLGALGYFNYFYNQDHLNRQCVAYNRRKVESNGDVSESMLILLNFSDYEQTIWIPFHLAGQWTEELNGWPILSVSVADQWFPITIPSHYGAIYKKVV